MRDGSRNALSDTFYDNMALIPRMRAGDVRALCGAEPRKPHMTKSELAMAAAAAAGAAAAAAALDSDDDMQV